MDPHSRPSPTTTQTRLNTPPPLQYQALARLIDLYYQEARELYSVLKDEPGFTGRVCLLSFLRTRDDWITTWRIEQVEFVDCILQENLDRRKTDPITSTRRRFILCGEKEYRYWETPLGEVFPDTFSQRVISNGKRTYLTLPKSFHKLLAYGIEHLVHLDGKCKLLGVDSNCVFLNHGSYQNHASKFWKNPIIGRPFIPERMYYTLRFQFSAKGPQRVPYADPRHVAKIKNSGIEKLLDHWRRLIYNSAYGWETCCWDCELVHQERRERVTHCYNDPNGVWFPHDSDVYTQIGLTHYAIQDSRDYRKTNEQI
ncbi:hypothetical protein QAD02_012282 [Eretmocerus hayati]|uniref:Uncharacterized protein n=1 Tax=Eretmocerus hayati TaxID=131215 RepID=A0ACC2NYZ2_9HYME|nr:hypothetical protein QAD02_012282 [Eretmocerus hayati]